MNPKPRLRTLPGRVYRIGGYAALAALAIVLIEGVADFIIQVVWLNSGSYGASSGLQPSTVIGWFQLFQNNRLAGLIDDAVLDIAVAALLAPLFLALFAALRRANEAWMAVAATLVFAGIAAYIPTNTGFSLLYVSDQYAAASIDAQRSLFLAAGQATVAAGGNGLFESNGFILVAVAGLIVALIMRRSKVFGRATSWVGVLANGLFMVNYVALAFVSAASVFSTDLFASASILVFIWWLLIARRLLRLGRGASKEDEAK